VIFCGQKTYNGVAILSRTPVAEIAPGMPQFPDNHKRVLAATIGDIRFVSLYVPNGQSVGFDKYQYKLRWLAAATAYLREELSRYPRLAVVGDFNIAPEDRDVHDPELWRGQVLCADAERIAFRDWLALGLKDAFRLFEQPEKTFSWWDYRQLAFPKNRGLRIDHVLLSPALAAACTACRVDRQARKGEKPSDHAPVIAELALSARAYRRFLRHGRAMHCGHPRSSIALLRPDRPPDRASRGAPDARRCMTQTKQ
jgi:exodeoxyribonuclease-3